MIISRISITGLFGEFDIDLEIRNNTIVLVGSNGLGKSTVLSIIYAFLSKQWDNLAPLPFDVVSAIIDDVEIRLTKDHLRSSRLFSTAPRSGLIDPRWSTSDHNLDLATVLSFDLETLREAFQATKFTELGIVLPRRDYFERIDELYSVWTAFKTPHLREAASELLNDGPLATALRSLDPMTDKRVMYLPTYRRIERTLKDLFPGMDEAVLRYQKKVEQRKRTSLIEFVRFGMDDVKKLFADKLAALRAHSSKVLSATSGSYLRDIIRFQGYEYEADRIRQLSDETILLLLQRYEGAQLTKHDVNTLLSVTSAVKANKPLRQEQELIAHYLIKIVEASESIADEERVLRNFVEVLNSYLFDKSVFFDNVDFSLAVKNEKSEIDLKDLSSGEKQIVSLFSHIYLENIQNLVFIDEPELSLSVPWQSKILPDILRSGRCEFLMAVTHSPFIFDNELDEFTIDMRSATRGQA
jgi:predicted ATPase